jgi:peptidoglycan/xylan/chitin deacetylase (PgdA/CDA1 family)
MRAHSIAVLAGVVCAACESSPILLYHSVGQQFDDPRWVSTQSFREQMHYLADHGYTVLSASEIEEVEEGRRPRPPRAIGLTFDDGFENFFVNAYPVLQELGFHATMFLITSRIGEDASSRVTFPLASLVWPEILEMQEHGIEMGSHTVSHNAMRGMKRDEMEHEAVDSKRLLEARLGRPVTVFAYPRGSFNATARDVVARAGYGSAFSVSSGLDRRFDRLRISVHFDQDLRRFAAAIDGTWWGDESGQR